MPQFVDPFAVMQDVSNAIQAATKRRDELAGITGFPGIPKGALLPGWAHITYYRHEDRTDDWCGPIIHETEDFITLEIWGERCSFLKDRSIIRRAE